MSIDPQHAALACRALRAKVCLDLRYRDLDRRVEVHAVGRSGEGAAVMRVWQVNGGSHSASAGWRLMLLSGICASQMTDEASQAPRPGFNPEDPAMAGGVICSV